MRSTSNPLSNTWIFTWRGPWWLGKAPDGWAPVETEFENPHRQY